MKQRDKFWVYKLLQFLAIIFIFAIISLYNILQFNHSYINEEREELQIFKRQIEWSVKPILKNNNLSELKKYCSDFRGEDVEFRIFNDKKKLIASSNPDNQTELMEKDSNILKHKYNSFQLYKLVTKDKKILVSEEFFVNNHKYYLELIVSQADVMKTILSVQKTLIIFFIICFTIFIFGLINIFHTLRNTFNNLEDSVIQVANGNLDTEIIIPKLDLLKELTLSIKKMVQRLKTQIKRLTQLEEYKSDFLQNITHEIKTPITAINSAIELLEVRNTISDDDKECFDIIQYQVKSINKLVNDILCLSEIEVQKTNENKGFKRFNLNETIEKIISYISAANTKLNFVPSSEVMIFADEELITTAVSNLITNAIKYSNSENIDIFLNNDNNKIKITIKDYGIGIEEKHINRIFDKFYRIDKARSRQLGGTGLGLAIVKNIVELHNGEITVESQKNKGTAFHIILSGEE